MNAFASNVQKVIFEVEVDVSGNHRPMDTKLFLGEDPASKVDNLCDVLFHRLVCQV